MWKPLLMLLALTVATGCLKQVPVDDTLTTAVTTAGPTTHGVESLGLAFSLPGSFAVAQDKDFDFLARSIQPRAVFSIARDSPGVVRAKPRANESLASIRLGAVEGVVITNAAIEGLPPGISAKELLVANGDRSFTVILSAGDRDAAAMWEVFISSLKVQPA
jgi:hypothetical protein